MKMAIMTLVAIGMAFVVHAETLSARWTYQRGILYREGKIRPRDLEKAVAYFSEAATQECVKAMEMLVVSYHNGEGVARDYAVAAAWCEEAALRGSAYSQFMMGVYRHSGMDGVCNPSEAIQWFRLAAKNGYGDANFSTGYDESAGCGQEVSLLWLENAANSGKPSAIYWLAASVQNGWGARKDLWAAFELYKAAAEKGNELAKFVVGENMWKGFGGTRNSGEKEMREAADAGNVTAILAVERLDETGRLP